MILINKDRKGLFFFTVKSSNGQILCHSEGYTRKDNCKNAVFALQSAIHDSIDEYGEGLFLIDKTNGVKK